MYMLTALTHYISFSSFRICFSFQERLLYHWLDQVLLLTVYFVKDGISTSPCYFYPINGVIHMYSWYSQEHFSQSTYHYSHLNVSLIKRSVLVKRSDLHALYLQPTNQHRVEGGKNYILVYNFQVSKFKWITDNYFEKPAKRFD